jgi:hypothetical protein
VKPAGDARYIRRHDKGEFKLVVERGKSLTPDRRVQVEDGYEAGPG